MFETGKLTVVGARSPQKAYIALRRLARTVQKMLRREGHLYAERIGILNFRVCNVMATTRVPFSESNYQLRIPV